MSLWPIIIASLHVRCAVTVTKTQRTPYIICTKFELLWLHQFQCRKEVRIIYKKEWIWSVRVIRNGTDRTYR